LAPLVALSDIGDVSVEWTARSLQAFADQPIEQLADAYDLVVIDHPQVPLIAQHGALFPLDGTGRDQEIAQLEKQSVGLSHASYWHGAHQYGLAIDAAAQVSVRRPDLLRAPAASWDEVLELSAAGRVVWPAKPVDAMSSFLKLAANMGAPVCSGPGRFIPRREGLAVLDLLHRLADSVDNWCLSADPIAVAEHLATSDHACYAPLTFGYVNYSRSGFRANRLAYADIPLGPRGLAGSCLGGAGIAVSARSAYREAAVAYAFFLARGDTQRGNYYWAGGQPANALAWEDLAINRDCLDFFRSTRASLEQAVVRPRYAGWVALQERVGDLVHATLERYISDEKCLESLDRECERLLAEEMTR
jgi:multiple sugar transport system substrate-binding protein